MRLRLAVVAALMLPLGWLSASPAHAQGGAVCSFAADFHVLPGWSQAPSRGTLSTGGETGSVDCVGVILGQEVLGMGTFGFTGEYGTGPAGGDTCSRPTQGDCGTTPARAETLTGQGSVVA